MILESRKITILFSIFYFLFFPYAPAHAAVCFYETEDGLQCAEVSTEPGDDGQTVNPQAVCEGTCRAIEACWGPNGTWHNYTVDTEKLTCPPPPTRLENPIRGEGQIDIPTFIGQVISGVLGLVGALTLLVFVYGGFLWLTSAGNEEKVRAGSQTMLYAAIGLFVVFGAYGILNLVIQGIIGGTP